MTLKGHVMPDAPKGDGFSVEWLNDHPSGPGWYCGRIDRNGKRIGEVTGPFASQEAAAKAIDRQEAKAAKQLHSRYRNAAWELHSEEGEIEIDPRAEVSVTDTGDGAWVQAWVWVSEADISDLEVLEDEDEDDDEKEEDDK